LSLNSIHSWRPVPAILRFVVGLFILPAGVLVGCTEIPVPQPAVRYLAFGDSTTKGPAGRDYVDILRELLGLAPETFANQGQSGETAGRGRERFESLLSMSIYPNADTLFYWQGGGGVLDFIVEVDGLLLRSPNDSDYPFSNQLTEKLDQIQAHIESVVGAARQAGWTVYVATYYGTPEIIASCDRLFLDTILPVQARNANAYMTLLNQRIRAAAVNQGAILVDVASLDDVLFSDRANYFDCSHLSAAGNQRVAEFLFSVINSQNGSN